MMANMAQWTDFRQRIVQLEGGSWDHIVASHDDMHDKVHLLETAISAPSFVVWDDVINRLEHHYLLLRPDLLLQVIVLYRPTPAGWMGIIRTAHLTDRLKKGLRLWP